MRGAHSIYIKIQYNAIRYDTIQYDAIRYDTAIQYKAIHINAISVTYPIDGWDHPVNDDFAIPSYILHHQHPYVYLVYLIVAHKMHPYQ